MKKNWSSPQMKYLGIQQTKDGVMRDPGNIEFNHTHVCKCGIYFKSWSDAEAHITDEANKAPGEYAEKHSIGVVPIS